MSFLVRFKLKKKKLYDIDFSYKMLTQPLQPMYQVLADDGSVMTEIPKTTIVSDLSVPPDAQERYGFYGLTFQELKGSRLIQVPKLETGMKYLASEGDYHIFKTERPYKSYEEYQGCSGAPILDEHGRLVSLVVEGDDRKTKILGLNLNFYKIALDATILPESRQPSGH